MFENRNLKHDLFALSLLGLVIFLTLALLTYDRADAVGELSGPLKSLYRADTLVYPQNSEITNACGRWGALTADMLLTGLGVGAYYLLLSLGTLTYLLLRRREIDSPILRAVGWIVSLVGVTAVASIGSFFLTHILPSPVVGAGGYLGALSGGLLQMHFAVVGSSILSLGMLLGGLLLCTDYALLDIAQKSFTMSAAGLQHLKQWRTGTVEEEDEYEEDEYEYEEEGEEEAEVEEPAIRIYGKRVDEATSEEAEEEEEEYEEDELEEEEDEIEEEAEEPTPAPVAAPHFNVKKPSKQSERDLVISQLEEASRNEEPVDYELPNLDLLLEPDDFCYDEQTKEVRRKAKVLEKTFGEFGFDVKVVEIETGPVIAQYEVQLEAGLRLSKITGLSEDLAIALRVPSVRIVAPIPGKNTVGIEVPNEERQVVRLREVMEEANGRSKKMKIPLYLGKDVSGKSLMVDLATLPHLLIAGRTGTGKSVCLNSIISSILMTRGPDEVRMLMIDPKMVELSGYSRLPHLMHPVVTDMRKAEAILSWAVDKMEERYSLLAKAGVRHVSSYNQLGEEELFNRLQPETDEEREAIPQHLPYIVIVADEIADLMMTSGKEVEQHIIRLAQKSRAVGIHLILATQKPTVDVITGLIKSNLPARIAFQVASRTDSRVVLDEMGADKLLGNGDMLFLWPGTSTLLRGQGTYLSDDEITGIVDSVSTGEQNFVHELVNLKVDSPAEGEAGGLKKRDDLYESAVDIVVRERRGSVSLLQRTLGVGYGRAARLIDYMAEDGIVGQYAGSQAREVLLSLEDWGRMQGEEPQAEEPAAVVAPKRRRSNVVLPEPEEEEVEDELEDEYEEEEDGEQDEADCEEEDEYEEEEDEYEEEYEEEEYEAESA